jgi:hypothetical protein
MIGRQCRSESLFYYFRIEDHVPESHLLQAIDRFVSLDFVREKLNRFIARLGDHRLTRSGCCGYCLWDTYTV